MFKDLAYNSPSLNSGILKDPNFGRVVAHLALKDPNSETAVTLAFMISTVPALSLILLFILLKMFSKWFVRLFT